MTTPTCANCRNAGRDLCAGCTWTEDASAPSYWRADTAKLNDAIRGLAAIDAMRKLTSTRVEETSHD